MSRLIDKLTGKGEPDAAPEVEPTTEPPPLPEPIDPTTVDPAIEAVDAAIATTEALADPRLAGALGSLASAKSSLLAFQADASTGFVGAEAKPAKRKS
jgi:hypothetical protein